MENLYACNSVLIFLDIIFLDIRCSSTVASAAPLLVGLCTNTALADRDTSTLDWKASIYRWQVWHFYIHSKYWSGEDLMFSSNTLYLPQCS